MEKGTDIARALGADNKAAAEAIEAMLQQVLVILVKRAGGHVEIPASEVDTATLDANLGFRVDFEKRIYHLEIVKKPLMGR